MSNKRYHNNPEYRKKIIRASVKYHKKDNGTYTVWANMLQRCENSNSPTYKYYGERGIGVCKEWHDYNNFKKDMGIKPNRLSIDRIDNDGNYELNNCRWATRKQQNENQRKRQKKEWWQSKKYCELLYESISHKFNHIVYSISDNKVFKNSTYASQYYNLSRERIRQIINDEGNRMQLIKYKDVK